MNNPKYKITPQDLESRGNIAKLERDGFTKDIIHKQMYKITDGMNTQQRTAMMSKLYERGK